tara:strand:+ start:251 stop:928 length:678 start_codon:yes stop_codon:yes gene_type:complete
MKKGYAGFSVVILAAGESKRFGSPKQLADFCGEPLLLASIRKVLACGITPYIALGANLELISQDPSLTSFKGLVINVQDWKLGQSESIKQSIRFFENRNISGVVFLLGDQPLIERAYLETFFAKVKDCSSSLLCTAYDSNKDKLGVPAYFPKEYFEQLLLLEGDVGAKQLLKKYCPDILKYQGELLDIDEPEDLVQVNLQHTDNDDETDRKDSNACSERHTVKLV